MAKRKAKKINRNHKFTMTVDEIENIRRTSVTEAVRITHYFPLFVLKEKFNFRQKRLHRFQVQYVDMWNTYNNSDLDLTIIAKLLYAKSGIQLNEFTDNIHKYDKSDKDKKISITKKEIDMIKKRSMNDAFLITSHFPLYVLMDKWGFGKVRLERFYDHYTELWNDINHGRLNLDDIAQVLDDEDSITWDEK